MAKQIDLKSKRNQRRAGATTIIELALYMMPTFATIFGFFDIGMVIFTWNTLQNAVREGVRYGITYQTQTGLGQVSSIKSVTSYWTLGLVQANTAANNGSGLPWIDVKFFSPTTLAETTANDPNNIIEVSIRNYPYRWMAPLSGSFQSSQGIFYRNPGTPMGLNVAATDVLGGAPVAGVPANN